MILRWRSVFCASITRHVVGLFVALVLWGSHVHGKGADSKSVIHRHSYFNSGGDSFEIGGNSLQQWINVVKPANSDKRQKFSESSTFNNKSTQKAKRTSDKNDRDSKKTNKHDSNAQLMDSQNGELNHLLNNVRNSEFMRHKGNDRSTYSPNKTGERGGGRRDLSDVLRLSRSRNGQKVKLHQPLRRGKLSADRRTFQDRPVEKPRRIDKLKTLDKNKRDKRNPESRSTVFIEASEDSSDDKFHNDQHNNDVRQYLINNQDNSQNKNKWTNVFSFSVDTFDNQFRPNVFATSNIRNTVLDRTSVPQSRGDVFSADDTSDKVSASGYSVLQRKTRDASHLEKLEVSGDNVIVVDSSTALVNSFDSGSSALQRQSRFATPKEGVESTTICQKFDPGLPERREFWSPNWPNNYPNNTHCTRVLSAEEGHFLRLDFRDEFHLEPSEGCKFDYLEVRDGAHGYGEPIGKYCGQDYPPMITSSGRHLWLRFHSDENIEYKGFYAVYESIPKPTSPDSHPDQPACEIRRDGWDGLISSSDVVLSRRNMAIEYKLPLECMWVIEVQEGWKIMLLFTKFSLSNPNDCNSNFVDVFGDQTDIPARLKSFCGSIADTVSSKSNILHVRFLALHTAINSSFEALFTAYRDSKNNPCTEDEFDCQDETCISKTLRCNGGIPNCRFRYDEEECTPKQTPLQRILSTDHIIIILVVFTLILFGMCFAFVFNCVRKLMRDHRIIRENIRQSRADRLDEIGIKVAAPHGIGVGRSRSNSSSNDDVRRSLSPRHLLRGARVDDQRSSSEEPPGRLGHPGQECYVPGAGDLMPILLGATTRVPVQTTPANGDAVFMRDNSQVSDEENNIEDLEMSNFPLPEMRDNECQTRESLFMNTNSDRSVTPPPPPPPVTGRQHNHPRQHNSRTQTHDLPPVGQFSTFGYNRDNRRDVTRDGSNREAPTVPKDYSTLPHHAYQKVAGIRKNEGPNRSKDVETPPLPKDYATLPHHPNYNAALQESQRFRAEAVIEMEAAKAAGGDDRPFSVDSTKSAPDVIVTH